jgi:3-hydroxyisobutyrate dehydrogenase
VSRRRVGIIGLGRMGLPMCRRLTDRGFAVVASDRRGELRTAVVDAGARWAGSAAELGASSDVVITMLPGPGEVSAIADEIIAALPAGATWLDMSSATPASAHEIAQAAAGRDVRILDAPVGGGPAQARDGRLLAFVGGTGEDVAAQRDVLDALADRVRHVGPAGSGYAVKLLVNLLWFGQALAAAEALSVAVRAGLDPETVRLAIQESAAASRFMEHDAKSLMAGDDLTSFSLARCYEELAGVLALGEQLDVPLALAERVTELYGQALEHYGNADGELLGARFVTERAGVDLSARGG